MNAFILTIYLAALYQLSHAGTVPPNSQNSDSLLGTTLRSDREIQVDGADECLNSSLDIRCDRVRPQDSSSIRVDNRLELFDRLSKIDRLPTGNNADFINIHNVKRAEGARTTLRQVILLHRHGDRTPISFPPKDTVKDEPFWVFHGYGQLTNRGKARLYLLGQLIRARYEEFLGGSVNKNQRISRSSTSLRCIESAQVFLSSFLGLNVNDSADAKELVWDSHRHSLGSMWQPASVQTGLQQYDGMLYEGAVCGSLEREYLDVIDKSEEAKKIFKEYKVEEEVLEKSIGYKLDYFYKWFWASSQIEVERSYFPEKMHPDILASYDRIQEAGNLALIAYQSTLKSKRLRSGLLIADMVAHMKKLRDLKEKADPNTSQEKKFVHYSAHDINLIMILGMLDVYEELGDRPDYASNLAIELHQDGAEWFVKIFYMQHTPSQPIEIHLKRCEQEHPARHCTLDMFENMMKPYMIGSWQEWMNECNNDLRSLNPYSPSS